METLRIQAERLWTEAEAVWLAGGWAMIPIAVIALVMFTVGANLFLRLSRTGFKAVPERVWRRWIERPEERRGRIGELLDKVAHARTVEETAAWLDEVRTAEAVPFERDLRVMKVCVGAAPLVGLLGTVTGMLATFGALSSGSGGDKAMAMIAGGISEALITTETGLVIALPGLFLQHRLARELGRYQAFLAHLETVVTQAAFKQRVAARRRAAETLRKRVREHSSTPRPRPARRASLTV